MKCTYASKEQKKQLISIVERIGIFLVKEAYERDNIKEINWKIFGKVDTFY